MRPFQRLIILFLLLLLPQSGLAGDALFLNPNQVDLSRLLAPPPAIGSPVQLREMAELLALQQTRTPTQVAFAQADAERSVFRFADVIGEKFTPENCPVTADFFKKVAHSASAVVDPAKDHWNRPRPFVANPALDPCVRKPHGPSYPSAHATFATVSAIVLANMFPEKAAAIFTRAAEYRLNREIGGVHYPSDVEAGYLAGTVIAAFELDNPAFQLEFAQAKSEARRVLGLP